MKKCDMKEILWLPKPSGRKPNASESNSRWQKPQKPRRSKKSVVERKPNLLDSIIIIASSEYNQNTISNHSKLLKYITILLLLGLYGIAPYINS